MTAFESSITPWYDEEGSLGSMQGHGWYEEVARERISRELPGAEERRLARLTRRTTFRARMARRLFGAAMVADREETWRIVWERLEAPRHP